jgi:hypothetical protein
VGSAETLAAYVGGDVITTAVAKIKDADAAAVTMAGTNLSTYSGEVT